LPASKDAQQSADRPGRHAADSGEHGLAQRYLTQFLAYARHAGDPALAAEILAAQAHQAL
jgi:hypothetical protein